MVLIGALAAALPAACAAPEDGDQKAEETAAAVSNHDFDVDFAGCTEFAGIGNVPAANARPLVPAHYTLAGDASNAVIVVRIARCNDATIDGHHSSTTKVSQIGISVTGQDATADINNYQLWYVTDQGLLNARFTAEGVDVDVDQHITFAFTPDDDDDDDDGGSGTLAIGTSPPRAPPYKGSGPAVAPTAAPVNFVASWWFDGKKGIVRSRTVFPAIRFGSATMTVTTPAGSALGHLIGGTSLTFPLLDSFNSFPAAHMEVRVVP